MRRTDLPTAEPRWSTRRITAAEVLRLARGEPVPGLHEGDPRVRAIRAFRLTNVARNDLADALRDGYLFLNVGLHEPQIALNLEHLWGWWCAAAGHPEIVLQTAHGTDAVRVTCDLSSTEHRWDFAAWRTIGRMLSQLHAVEHADWLFTPEELQLDGLEMEEAITIARGLVDIATAGRFRPETEPRADPPPRAGTPFPSTPRIERTNRSVDR